MTDKPHDDLIARLKGRSSFCRDRGEVKTPALLDAAAAALADAATPTGWVIANGNNNRWRCVWEWESNVDWTDDITQALKFATREDAERYSKEDEDAWLIYQVGIPPTTTPVVGAEQACGVRQAVPEWGTSDKAQHYAAMVTDTNDADILRAAIIDLCRDNERLAVMLKSAKQPDPTPPTALSGPPKDGRMLCLLVDYSDGDHPLEDAKQAWTIGYNTLADTGDDEWLIAGWSWEQDCYTDGRGTVIGWLPFPCDPAPALGWRAMQTAAAELMQSASAKCRENFTFPAKTKEQRDWQTGAIIHANATTAILALPGPTDAQALAEAVKLEAVRELVKAAKWIGVAAQTTGGTAGPDLDLIEAIDVLADALAQIGGAA